MRNIHQKLVISFCFFMGVFTWFSGCNDHHTAQPEGVTSSSRNMQPTITGKIPEMAPPTGGRMVFDEQRDTYVFVKTGPFQTWEWNGEFWVHLYPTDEPRHIGWCEIIYFAKTESIILIGNHLDNYSEDLPLETYQYDGTSWSKLGNVPTEMYAMGEMVYDPGNERLLYTGGTKERDYSSYVYRYFDVWSFDGFSWTRIAEEPDLRRSYNYFSIGYDPDRARLVLAGAFYQTCTASVEEMWEFDGEYWELVNDSETQSGYFFYDSAYSSLFALQPGGPGAQIFRYEKGEWQLFLEFEGPFLLGTTAYDRETRTLLSYHLPSTLLFSLDGSWSDLTTLKAPGNHTSSMAAYFPDIGATVFVVRNYCFYDRLETWTWDGETFTKLDASPELGNYYGYLESAELLYVPKEHCLFLISTDYVNRPILGVLKFDGEQWSPLEINFPEFFHQWIFYFSAAYFPKTDSIILFGGSEYSDGIRGINTTWQFKNNEWTIVRTKHSPPKRVSAHLVYHRKNDTLLLFGGLDDICLNDTWEFDGQDWRQIETIHAPEFRNEGMMYYDEKAESVILVGGRCWSDTFSSLWEFAGEDWKRREYNGIKPKRYSAACAYDAMRQCAIIAGGSAGNDIYGSLLEINYE